MRCIEIGQKLIMSPDKADVKYDRALIQKLFLRTLERGILSQVVAQEVKHLLKQVSLCDEELLSAITKVRIPISISMYLRQLCVRLILNIIRPVATTVVIGTLE